MKPYRTLLGIGSAMILLLAAFATMMAYWPSEWAVLPLFGSLACAYAIGHLVAKSEP